MSQELWHWFLEFLCSSWIWFFTAVARECLFNLRMREKKNDVMVIIFF